MPFSQPIVCPVLIGRDDYRVSLDRLASDTRGGRGHTVLVSGDAGIGKSRLVSEFIDSRAREGWLILQADCHERSQTQPFAPWLDLTRRLMAPGSELARSRFLTQDSWIAGRLFPDLANLHDDTAIRDAPGDRGRLFGSLFDFLTTQAFGAPMAVIIEDAHWADEASLALALHVARSIRNRSVVLVLTYRDHEVGESLAHVLAELDRHRLATELTLEPLSPRETREMIRTILRPGGRLDPAAVARVVTLTEGNPFFVEEVLRSLLGGSGPPLSSDAESRAVIPRSVRESVRRRSTALSTDARRLVQVAAIIGRNFDFALLCVLAGLDEGPALALIKELIGAQLIIEESADRFQFRHALTREAICSEMLEREQQALHGLVASSLEERDGEARTTWAGELGYHFFEARRFAKALEYCQIAGEWAERMWSPGAAVEHYSRALTAARELSQAPSVALLRARGRSYEALGDFDRALRDQQLALATARLNDQRQAEWQALIDLGMLWAARNYDRSGEYYQQALDLAEALGDETLLAHSLNRIGNWYGNRELAVVGLDYHKRALALFEALGDPQGVAATLDLLGMACFMACDLVQGIAYYRRAAPLLRELDDRVGLASCLAAMTLYGRSTLQQDTSVPCDLSPAEALEYSEEAQKLGAAIGRRSAESFALWNRAVLLAAQGDYLAAVEAATRGQGIAEEIGHDQWIVGASYSLGVTYLDLFCFELAERHLRQAKHLADETQSLNWIRHVYGCLAFTRAARGDDAEADALMGQILTENTPSRALGERVAWTMAAELAIARGDAMRALAVVERLKAATPNLDRGPRGVRLSQLEGMALAGVGRNEEAEEVLRIGRDDAVSEGSVGRQWRIEAALVHLYRAMGRGSEAEAASVRARTIVADLLPRMPDALHPQFLAGACAILPDLRSLLRPTGRLRGADGLTNRERSVATLIGQGLSNRAVAEALVVSERTVETHVSNILAKLRFNSRVQIAAWVTERGIAQVHSGI